MSTDDHRDASAPDPAEIHTTSWSVNLEHSRYAQDADLAIADAFDAIERTAPGYHVNLVTHAELGHPETYLFDALDAAYGDLGWEYVDQCGCGGHVTRVHVE